MTSDQLEDALKQSLEDAIKGLTGVATDALRVQLAEIAKLGTQAAVEGDQEGLASLAAQALGEGEIARHDSLQIFGEQIKIILDALFAFTLQLASKSLDKLLDDDPHPDPTKPLDTLETN